MTPHRNTTIACRASRSFTKRLDQLSEQLGSGRSEVLRLGISELLKNCQSDEYFQQCKEQLY
jgi:hypothetical protein